MELRDKKLLGTRSSEGITLETNENCQCKGPEAKRNLVCVRETEKKKEKEDGVLDQGEKRSGKRWAVAIHSGFHKKAATTN